MRYALHRLRAAGLPIATLLNYIINYRAARVLDGRVSELDAFAYTLGASGTHFGGSAFLAHGAIEIPGLRVPLRELSARFDLFDGGVASERIAASVAGLPVEAAGGIFNWQAPSFRIGFRTGGALETLRTLFNFSRALPLAGDLQVGGIVEGAVGQPLLQVRFASRRVAYGNFPLDRVLGDLVYYDSSVALVRTAANYGPFASVARGTLDLGERATSQLVVDGSAPPASVPFVAQAVPQVPLRVTAVLAGSDLALEARGIADGAAGDESLRGLFRLDQNGDGEFGPFGIRQGAGSATGAFYADRSAAQSGFWLDAQGFTIRPGAPGPRLPGLPNLYPPDFAGRLDARLAGEGHPSNFRLAGDARVAGLSVGTYRIGSVAAHLSGAPSDLRAGDIAAEGPWGTFSGSGAYAPGGLALVGRYRGSLEQLATFTGQVGAKGPLDAPVALLLGSGQTIVQSTGLDLPADTVRGVPVSDVRGTIGVSDGRLRVYAATARVAGGTLAAAGSVGGSGRLGVALAGADAAHLRGLGSPLETGRIAALGTVDEAAGPGFQGAVSIAAARAGKLALAGSSGVALQGDRLALRDGEAVVDGTYGSFAGTLSGVGRGAAALDLAVATQDARLGPFARLLLPARHDIAGTFEAQVRVRGTTASPSVSGHLGLSEGSFSGQAFRDASAEVAADRRGLEAQDGTVAVGSTRVGFSGAYRPGNWPRACRRRTPNLSDFDDLFDTGDTLDGTGSLRANFSRRGRALATSADARLSACGTCASISAIRARAGRATDATSPARSLSAASRVASRRAVTSASRAARRWRRCCGTRASTAKPPWPTSTSTVGCRCSAISYRFWGASMRTPRSPAAWLSRC